MGHLDIVPVGRLILSLGELSQLQNARYDGPVAIADLATKLQVNGDRLAAQCRELDDRDGLVLTSFGPSVRLASEALPILDKLKRLADRQKREREHRLTASLFRLHKYAVERDKPFESFANIPLRKEYSDAEIEAAYAALETDDIVEKVGTIDVGGATGRKSRYRVTEKGKGTADMLAELPADPASPPASQEEESKLDGW